MNDYKAINTYIIVLKHKNATWRIFKIIGRSQDNFISSDSSIIMPMTICL